MSDDSREIQTVLRRVRRRWMTWTTLRTIARVALGVALIVALATSVDAWRAPNGILLILLAALTTMATVTFAAWCLWPLRRTPAPRQIARFLEEHCPELEDRLATAVQVASDSPAAVQTLLAGPLLADAAASVRRLDLERAISRRAIGRATWMLVGGSALLLVSLGLARRPADRAYQTAAGYLFPSRLTLHVTPGDVKVAAGRPLEIIATLSPSGAGLVPVLRMTGAAKPVMAMESTGRANEFSARFAAVTDSFRYVVVAGKTRSSEYAVKILRPPRVVRINLRYEFPPVFGLPPRTEEDSGDIYAPAGTQVRLHIEADQPVVGGELTMADGSHIPLMSGRPQSLDGEIKIEEDGSYRVALASEEGLRNPDDTEYFIRMLEDQPPEVSIVKPASDRQVTRLEEVTIEARATDDFGIDRFELVYSVRGLAEKSLPFNAPKSATSVVGSRILYLEELDIQAGDFVTYYARAKDVTRGKRSTESRSDIFFLEVKPFEEEFEAAISNAMSGGGGGGDTSLEMLVAAQKEIIIATWKLDRRAVRGQPSRSEKDIRSIARAQGELKEGLQRQTSRGREASSDARRRRSAGQPGAPATPDSNPMVRAVQAMERAQAALDALRTADAIPHETDAYSHLLKALAEVRRRQVSQQPATASSGGGMNRSSADLSTLFDRELRKDQQTNYEMQEDVSREGSPHSDALERVRELARRQSELERQQQDLARQRAQMTAEELKRQLERLTREQSELRRQTEELSRQLDRSAQSQSSKGGSGESQSQSSKNGMEEGQSSSSKRDTGGGADSRSLREISEEMQGAASGLRRQDPKEASTRSGRALEKLRDLERRLQNAQPNEERRALGDLQLEARQIADAERQLGSELQRMGDDTAAREALRRVAGEKQRLAARVEDLQQNVKRLSRSGSSLETTQRAAVAEAEREIERQRLPQRMRESASAIRAAGDRTSSARQGKSQAQPSAAPPIDMRQQAQTEQALAQALDRVAERLASAAESGDGESRKLSEQLSRTQAMRDRLASLERQLGQAKGEQGQDGKPGQANQPTASSQGQPGKEGPSQRESRGSSPDGGPATGDGDVGRVREEYARELQRAQELVDQLHAEARRGGNGGFTPEGQERSFSAPGTEWLKQDFSKWEGLRKNVNDALEQIENALSNELRGKEARDRLTAGADERPPQNYRLLVDKYFQSLAAKKKP